MRPPVFPIVVLIALLLGGLSTLGAASVGAESQVPDLVGRADLIGEFELVDAHPEMLPDGSIQTAYTFSTLTPMKGRPASILEIRMPGGEIAGRGLYLPGMPEMQIGDRHILFLSSQGQEKPWRLPVGLSAGAWKVQGGGQEAQVSSHACQEEGIDVRNYREFVAEIMEEVARQL